MPDSGEHDGIPRPGRRTFVQSAAMAGVAMLAADAQAPREAAAQPLRGDAAMADEMTFEDVRKLLDLTPNATYGLHPVPKTPS